MKRAAMNNQNVSDLLDGAWGSINCFENFRWWMLVARNYSESYAPSIFLFLSFFGSLYWSKGGDGEHFETRFHCSERPKPTSLIGWPYKWNGRTTQGQKLESMYWLIFRWRFCTGTVLCSSSSKLFFVLVCPLTGFLWHWCCARSNHSVCIGLHKSLWYAM